MRKKLWWIVLVVLLVCGLTGYAVTRPEPSDTRFTGAYVLDEGSFVFIAPREGKVLRYRTMQGESGALWRTASSNQAASSSSPPGVKIAEYEGGDGWAQREPVTNRIRFELSPDGHPLGLSWQKGDAPPRHAVKVRLSEEIFTFRSGTLTLRGKLVRPEAKAPLAAVVLVHGSDADSAVDDYFEPYMYAANGFASLVFDKRGTGKSEGEYVQNFSVLADDVRAAVRWLREQPGIDPAQVHLAGFSQGGWIAPLAAFRDGGIRSLLIGYGPMVPVTGEDRWGYVDALRTKGFGDDAIASADRLDAVIGDILDRNRNRWSELGTMLDASRGQPWFDAVKGSDSVLGELANSKMPLWVWRSYVWWKLGRHHDIPFIDRLYNPVPTVAALSTPSLWIFGGRDSSMPTQWSVDELKALQASGKPVEYFIYPEADHGILHVVDDGKGEHHVTGYEPGYFQRQIDWLRQHGGDSP